MTFQLTSSLVGTYMYVYPTFADKPQLLTVHFVTPDQQNAFVTYPNHKVSQFIPMSWFDSVSLVQLEGQSQLMHFLEVTLPGWLKNDQAGVAPIERPLYQLNTYAANAVLTA